MQRRHLLTMVVALAAALSLIFVIPVAAENGRDAGAKAGIPILELPTEEDAGSTGSDLDEPPGASTQHDLVGNAEIDGSMCVGTDCVINGETYGFDTIRLKENNLRIRVVDTSNAASFPTNDWALEFNASANGGSSHFMVRDCGSTGNNTSTCGGTAVFTVEAGARSNALFVEADGDIGIGTSNPGRDVDIKTGDSPTVRLQQDGTSGFTPQTWDMAGNEAGFFVRDATSGSTLPFRIRVGAPSSAIDIASNGDVGMGVGGASVARPLHIRSSGAVDPEIRLENADESGYYEIRVNDSGALIFRPDDGGVNMVMFDQTAVGNQKLFTIDNGAGTEIFNLQTDGDLIITGILTSSDRNLKTKIRAVEAHTILDKVSQLDISTWAYKANLLDRHIGPMAQDWHRIIGLGSTQTHISQTDVNGVLLASIQALSADNAALRAQVDQLGALEVRLAELEAQLAALLVLSN